MITKKKIWFYCFGGTEVLIGFIQGVSVILRGVLNVHSGILFAAGCLSFFLGLGIIRQKVLAVNFLIFFASGVAFSKFLILAGVFTLPPESQILLPKTYENIVSVFYHLILVVFLLKNMKLSN